MLKNKKKPETAAGTPGKRLTSIFTEEFPPSTVGGTRAKRRTSLLHSQKIAPYVFVSPFILMFCIFYIYPVISTVIMSFQKVLPGETTFVGLQNFRNLFFVGDTGVVNSDFTQALTNNVIYTIITIAVVLPVPMLLAVFLDSKKMIGKNFFRSVMFLPALVSVVVAGLTFRLIFGELPHALLNDVLGKFGVEPIKWLGGPAVWTTFFALLVLCCWRWFGVNTIYYLSGLQQIPQDLYESADLDGANAWQKFRYITVPMLKPVTVYVLTISIYGGLAMFLESYMLFNGARSPGGVGNTIVGYLYRLGVQQNNIGFACAVGLVLLVVTLTINMIQLKITGFFKKEG